VPMGSEDDNFMKNETDTILFHYTSIEGLRKIINSKSIWATNVLYLNDASELNYSIKLLKEEINNLKSKLEISKSGLFKLSFLDNIIGNLNDYILKPMPFSFYVSSFSEEKDLLSQWRGYCPKGVGFSVGFNLGILTQFAKNNDYSIHRCNYKLEDCQKEMGKLIIEIFERYDTEIKNPSIEWGDSEWELFTDLFVKFVSIAPTFKHPKFEAEKEWRIIARMVPDSLANLIKFRTGESMLIPYIEVPIVTEGNEFAINQIVVGPTHDPKLSKASVEMLLKFNGVKFDEVLVSTIPYRNW
jgi:hypothetical protein